MCRCNACHCHDYPEGHEGVIEFYEETADDSRVTNRPVMMMITHPPDGKSDDGSVKDNEAVAFKTVDESVNDAASEMDAGHGARRSGHNLRPRRRRSYSQLHLNYQEMSVAHLEELNKGVNCIVEENKGVNSIEEKTKGVSELRSTEVDQWKLTSFGHSPNVHDARYQDFW